MQLKNRKLIFTFAFTSILIAIGLIVSNWIRNPYGLEAERLGPKSRELSRPITKVPHATNYLLYAYVGESNYAIHLALPNHYIHESRESNRIHESYSVSAYMYYPELNGKFHPDNANLPSCNGFCGGYVSASIEPRNENSQKRAVRNLERISMDKNQGNAHMKFEDLSPEFDIEEHFQVRYPMQEEKSGGKQFSTKEYLIKRDGNGEVKYFFKCDPFVPSPSCSVEFNLSTRPELVVNITFGRHLMAQWEDLINATDAKISSWGPKRIETVK